MNKTLSTILIVLAVLAVLALAGGLFFFGTIYNRFNAFGPMMNFGYNRNNNNTYGPGMMSRSGYGMGPGMMGGYGWNNGVNTNVTPLTVDQAKSAAEKYLANLNNSDLEISEVMIFDNNAYVAVKETSTGLGAFELLVDPASQVAYPEYGPNMMWNQKYGGLNHGYMMGGFSGMMGSGWNKPKYESCSGIHRYACDEGSGHQERTGLSRPISARNDRGRRPHAVLRLLHTRFLEGWQGRRNVERQRIQRTNFPAHLARDVHRGSQVAGSC